MLKTQGPPNRLFRATLLLLLSLTFPKIFHAQIQTDVQINMSDGVSLEARIMKPIGFPPSGGFDGIILVHGYGGSKGDMQQIAQGLAIYGYASIAYSVRGQGGSGGCSTVSGPRERQDLLEVVNYFRNYSQINPDRIGITGGSQGGIHSWMAAVDRMPGVKTAVPIIGTPNFGGDLAPNNCVTRGLVRELRIGSVRYCDDVDSVRNLIVADEYDSLMTYIAARDLSRQLDSIRIPVFQQLGWADYLIPANSGIKAREAIASRGIPVWSYFGTNGHGESFDTAQALTLLDKTVKWFDHWIKGFSLEGDSLPMVLYADDSPGWPMHTTPVWPPQPYSTTRFYITASGLSLAPPSDSTILPFTLEYDTAYPAATAWDDLYGGPAFMNAFTNNPVRLMSEPLDNDAEVTGIPGGRVNVRSDAGKFQSHVRYYDVRWEDTGYVWTFMSRAINALRGNTPGEWRAADLEGRALSHIVPKGHRVGIEITSFDLLNTDQANTIPFFLSSHSELLSSAGSPSWIEMPIVGPALTTDIDEELLPQEFALGQNYPNPFNPATIFSFRLSKGSFVTLKIFDLLGREVSAIVSGYLPAGEHSRRWDAAGLAGGVYLYRLHSEGNTATKKLVLLK
ncbi:MAG TPA: alpha/beta fold hydrolase [Bacteroidota bacterium]|nr:alpha/beta fold hydrolase [Bacteroidota bacterium]